MEATYSIPLVALSYVVSVFGSYTALQLAIGIPGSSGSKMWLWLSTAAIALGGAGIWSMHFIGMLAYDMGMPVAYDIPLTVGSMLIAVAVVGIGLYIVGRSKAGFLTLVFAGTITGLGVASMHYSGMAAMRMPAEIQYDTMIVAISVVIAVVAATAALWLAFNMRGAWQRFGSALVMGVAVCGMHYTGMAAMTMVASPNANVEGLAFDTQTMAGIIFGVSAAILIVLLLLARAQLREVDQFEYVK